MFYIAPVVVLGVVAWIIFFHATTQSLRKERKVFYVALVAVPWRRCVNSSAENF
jgi:hypothetical protein